MIFLYSKTLDSRQGMDCWTEFLPLFYFWSVFEHDLSGLGSPHSDSSAVIKELTSNSLGPIRIQTYIANCDSDDVQLTDDYITDIRNNWMSKWTIHCSLALTLLV